jgi:hypothetical protein
VKIPEFLKPIKWEFGDTDMFTFGPLPIFFIFRDTRVCRKCGEAKVPYGFLRQTILQYFSPKHWLCEKCYKEIVRIINADKERDNA